MVCYREPSFPSFKFHYLLPITPSTLSSLDPQHWPFPASSLMIGCIAVVDNQFSDIEIDGDELEDARWFSRDQVSQRLNMPTLFGNVDVSPP